MHILQGGSLARGPVSIRCCLGRMRRCLRRSPSVEDNHRNKSRLERLSDSTDMRTLN